VFDIINQYSAGAGLLLSRLFWVAFAGVFFISVLTEKMPVNIKHAVFIITNIFFLFYFTGIGAGHIIFLVADLSLIYIAGKKLITKPRNPQTIFSVVLGILILFWAIAKVVSTQKKSPLSFIFFIGISYLLVKIWTFLKDVRNGYIKDISFVAFLNYCTYFPCFISGPMHYYNEFAHTFENRIPLDKAKIIHYLCRVLYGIVKVRIIAVALRPYSLDFIRDATLSTTSIAGLFIRSLVYSLVLYFDFSGYCDVAIGSSGLLGISVPENFRLPYIASNIRDFWQRWHITFTRFLTQYMFIPFTRSLQNRLLWTGAKLAVVAYLFTFAFVGFWHGSTLNFLAWGIYLGIGLSIYDVYKRYFSKRAVAKEPSFRSTLVRYAAVLFTFLFISVGWIFFVLPVKFFF